MANWRINIDNPSLGGLAPQAFHESYPSFGNKNQAGSMQNMDLTNPGYIDQGPGWAILTNGDSNGVVTTLIKGIVDSTIASNTTYGVGGTELYKFSNTTVTSDGTWPHTIDKAAVTGETGEDVAYYKGALYYSYNHSGSAGDIGKFDLSSTFDDDWGSTTPTGAAALEDALHPFANGGNDILYFGNGRYVGDYDGTTFDPQALDLPEDASVYDIKWFNDKLWILANRPDLSIGSVNKVTGSIYVWDGVSSSWELEIPLIGGGGALHVYNGTMFVFYDNSSLAPYGAGESHIGYINGSSIVDLGSVNGALPYYYQVTSYKGFILWIPGNEFVYAWGSGGVGLPNRIFQYSEGSGSAILGGIATPFLVPILATNATNLSKISGVDTDCNWKSLIFDITGYSKEHSSIDGVRFNFESLGSGARVDWSLVDNAGRTIYSDTVSQVKGSAGNNQHSLTTAYFPLPGLNAENFRVELNYSNGSTTQSVKIKRIMVYGTN